MGACTCGFEMRDTNADGIILVIPGTYSYQSVVAPGSTSQRSFYPGSGAVHRRPFTDGVSQSSTPWQPSSDEYWFQVYMRTPINDTWNDSRRVGVGRDGSQLFEIAHEDSTDEPTLWVAGSYKPPTASSPISVGVFRRYHVHVAGHTQGSVISVYASGNIVTPIFTYTLTAGDETALSAIGLPNEFCWQNGSLQFYIDDLWCMDPNDGEYPTNIQLLANAHVAPVIVNGAGNYQDQATGAYTDIDELPPSDGDEITFDATDQAATFTVTAAPEDQVYLVTIHYRMTRSGTDAGSNMQPRVNSISSPGTFKDYSSNPAPGDGNVIRRLALAYDNAAWSKAKYDNAEFGLVSRT